MKSVGQPQTISCATICSNRVTRPKRVPRQIIAHFEDLTKAYDAVMRAPRATRSAGNPSRRPRAKYDDAPPHTARQTGGGEAIGGPAVHRRASFQSARRRDRCAGVRRRGRCGTSRTPPKPNSRSSRHERESLIEGAGERRAGIASANWSDSPARARRTGRTASSRAAGVVRRRRRTTPGLGPGCPQGGLRGPCPLWSPLSARASPPTKTHS